MKNNQQTVVKTGTATTTRSKKMGLSSDNLALIMSILTNMYGDAYEATLREYACNALDSHVAAGSERAIEVTLPTILSPALLIQDYGVGLSEDEIFNVYAEYGKSTKNDSDDEVGGFGIGAKSAFTMGSQFIVTGVKDGMMTVVKFSMGTDGVPETELRGTQPTEQPNGVLISLAVEDIDRMHRTAQRVFSTWDTGRVLVDGEAPASVFEKAFYVNGETALVKEHTGKIYVTLGPVAYPVSSEQFTQVVRVLGEADAAETASVLANWDPDHGTSVFFRARVGDMDIAPNREQLRDTRKTIAALSAMVTGLSQDLTASVQARLDACVSPYQAAREFNRATDDIAPLKVSRKAVHYTGMDPFRAEVTVSLKKFGMASKGWTARGGYSTVEVVREWEEMTLDVRTSEHVLVVVGVEPKDEGAVKRYVKRYVENNEDGIQHVMVSPAMAASYGWFQYGVEGGVKTVTLTEWRAILKEMRGTVERTTNEPSYTVGVGQHASRDLADRELLSDILSWGKDIVVFNSSAPSGSLAAEVLEPYTVLVLLATQSEAALLKRIEADGTCQVVEVNVREKIRKLADKRLRRVSADERAALGAIAWLDANVGYNTRHKMWQDWNETLEEQALATLPEWSEIQEMVEIVSLVAEDITADRKRELSTLTAVSGTEALKAFEVDFHIPKFEKAYPLLAQMGTSSLNERYNRENHPAVLADTLAYLIAKNS